MLGTVFENGQGVDQDPRAAQEWYEKAARRGELAATVALFSFDVQAALSALELSESGKFNLCNLVYPTILFLLLCVYALASGVGMKE